MILTISNNDGNVQIHNEQTRELLFEFGDREEWTVKINVDSEIHYEKTTESFGEVWSTPYVIGVKAANIKDYRNR